MRAITTSVNIDGKCCDVTAWEDGSVLVTDRSGVPVQVAIDVVRPMLCWSVLDSVSCKVVTSVPKQELKDRAAAVEVNKQQAVISEPTIRAQNARELSAFHKNSALKHRADAAELRRGAAAMDKGSRRARALEAQAQAADLLADDDDAEVVTQDALASTADADLKRLLSK